MAGGVIFDGAKEGKDYPGKLTAYVFLSCLLAAAGGLIFGYDIGISGMYNIDYLLIEYMHDYFFCMVRLSDQIRLNKSLLMNLIKYNTLDDTFLLFDYSYIIL